ncbi:hypothetical protein [Fictibacillus terranigra]|uniref:Uncharacterized protein n=1 Tax=Fictibacillus terranigra TaxID=3058424 RepID=A0ABT8E4M5_9BACL|nr:hypothetical protein [Fictibacillus sp. CENA-BCM004]MDN4072834.1 hypothetical protein [Fictibacillus sp. CENA-BCM004]
MNVFAWVTRNSSTFAPVMPLCLGRWDIVKFYLNVHPVWIGMIINILTIMSASLIDNADEWKWSFSVSSFAVYLLEKDGSTEIS